MITGLAMKKMIYLIKAQSLIVGPRKKYYHMQMQFNYLILLKRNTLK